MGLEILQIAPSPGGVFDYAKCLESEWNKSNIRSSIIEISAQSKVNLTLSSQVLSAIGAQYPAPGILLHFSGYGFASRGLCFWLVQEMQALRKSLAGRSRVAISFHELFAFGPPWKSAFWVNPPQRWIAAKLASIGDVVFTNTDKHAHWLRGHVGAGVPIITRPVFSNVGELEGSIPPWSARSNSFVVFGSQATRRRVFAALRRVPQIEPRLRGIQCIEVGSGSPQSDGGALPRDFRGEQSGSAISQLLTESRFGIIDYPDDQLTKSGVFAAFAAHGVLVCNTVRRNAHSTFPRRNVHFVGPSNFCIEDNEGNMKISTNAFLWYREHALAKHALDIREALMDC